jgi:hypothetical protein
VVQTDLAEKEKKEKKKEKEKKILKKTDVFLLSCAVKSIKIDLGRAGCSV